MSTPRGTVTRTDEEVHDVAAALRGAGVRDVDDSRLAKALYSSDASLYRVLPRVVVRPRDIDEVLATLEVCRTTGTPLTARGAGTSIAGNAVGSGVVLDLARHLDTVGEIDPEARTAVVQPGVVQASLQRAAAPHELRFGPDPSTHNRCTIGGMIGNNACGSRALGYGRTADNVAGLDVVTAGGLRMSLTPSSPMTPILDRLREVVDGDLSTIRTELGRFSRQVSGYSLEHLLPESGFDVAKALVGTEGTLAVVLGATVRLVTTPRHRALVVLAYPSMAVAADDVPSVLAHRPIACEGLDSRIVDVVRASGAAAAVPPLPPGEGWLFVEVVGDTESEVADAAARVVADAATSAHEVVIDAAHMAALWRIREDGAGLAARSLSRPALAGWEDAAVPPAQLGAYLRDFEDLMTERGVHGVPYGHFGDGCVHIRIDFPLQAPDGPRLLRSFVEDAARLVASYGGSLSGEHGDGRARSALLPLMYSADAIALFKRVKTVFDPTGLLNPGVLVDAAQVDDDLRLTARTPVRARLGLRLIHDAGDLSAAVHRCTGVGKCLADNTGSGGVMCPSYLATRNEKDSTRGRARVLQEMVGGSLTSEAFAAPEVHDALDLCLACKGCANDCPTGVDMASYKVEALHQRYRHRVRPRSHYTLGWLPRWARLASTAPALANLGTTTRGGARLATWVAGVDRRRSLPRFASQTLRSWARGRAPSPDGPRVALWADTFTNHFTPEVGRAAVEVLEAAGYSVEIPDRSLCCGLTWISTGQVEAAGKILRRTVTTLAEYVDAGVPVVGLEPSCTAVLRADAVDLLADPAARSVAGAVRTLAEQLAATPGWQPPDLSETAVVAQPHCHHASVLGWSADQDLLRRSGAQVRRLGGCCGLAGNFGVERRHHDVSVAVAEHDLLPAVRSAAPGTVILTDGFSCRTQLDDLAGVQGTHLAELLAAARGRPTARDSRFDRGSGLR
ncbi:MAG: FAD-binding and (Fe-S)-binding domain-containing protein [Nocardioidaceae bacterium]